MTTQPRAGQLPESLCQEAKRLGLHVEGGEVMFESDIGGGLFNNYWMTAKEGGIRIEVRIIGELPGRPQEYEELMRSSKTDIIDEVRALGVIQRWGVLHSLEWRHASQKRREAHEKDDRSAAFGGNSNRA
jgi:hypothetical protein